MIYQFKVNLKHMQPPVWRRLQVDSDMTFHDFHHVLQAAFDWGDDHLHSFSMRKRNGRTVEVEIEPIDEDFGLFSFRDTRDEFEENLSDWFLTEKDRAIYTYDFGDNWEHEIVLEKIVEQEEGVQYPRCLKAMRLAPAEDSSWIEEEWPQEEMDWRELTAEVNEALEDVIQDVNERTIWDEEQFDWKTLIEKAKMLNAMKPWEVLDDNQIFAIADPMDGQLLFCSVLGAGGKEYGLGVYIGDEGLHALRTTLSDEPPLDIFFQQRSLLLSFSDRDELDNQDYQFLKQLGLSFRGRKQWVQLRSFVPGYYPWMLDEEEGRMLLLAIEQTMEVIKNVNQANNILPYMGEDVFFGRAFDETGTWQSVYFELEPKGQFAIPEPDPELYLSELDIKRLKKMQTLDVAIVLDAFMVDMPVQDMANERPYFPVMVAAMEERSGTVLYHTLLQTENPEGEIQYALKKVIELLNGLPSTILLKSHTERILSPVLEQLPMETMVSDYLPQVEDFRMMLSRMQR